MPAPVFSCPHAEHQFDIREPVVVCVHLVYLIRWRHSAPILRVILFHGGEGREHTENPTLDKTIRERPNRADKNGAIIVPPLVSPCVPPPVPLTARHATRHGIAELPTPRPHDTHTATPRHATPPRTYQPRTRLPATPPTTRPHDPPPDTTDGTNTKGSDGTTRKDETAREHELTKTAQQDNTNTIRPTPRNAETRRDDKTGREAKRQRRHENANPRDTNGTPTRDDKTRRETERQHERETKRSDMRIALPPPPTAHRPPASIYDATTTGQHAKTS